MIYNGSLAIDRLAKEYLSKIDCCDECFCEYWCIENETKRSRCPYKGCEDNIIKCLAELFRDKTLDNLKRGIYMVDNNSPKWARKPKEQKYNPVDFETVGKCPNCNNTVISSICHTDTTCRKCGLKLYWDE